MNKMLSVNIRQFEDNEFSKFIVDGEIDTESIIASYQEETETETETETEADEVENNDTEVNDGLEDSENQDQITENQDHDNTKRTPDQAFAEMRRRAEANEPLAKWVTDLATQQGFSDPQELISEYQKQQMAREAEAQGVPVDVYQRLHELEQENMQQKELVANTNFNHDVETVKQKHNLSDDQLTEVFRFMGQYGYEAGSIPFEHAYMLANSDTLIKSAEERGRQTYLEQKQKQQQQATPNISTNANDTKGHNELDMSKEAIFAKLAEFDIDPD